MIASLGLPPVPVPPPQQSAAIVRPFDPPGRPWDAGHRGIDLAAPGDGLVRSLAPGVVSFAGAVGSIPVVAIRVADGRRVTYQPVRASVVLGQTIGQGQVLGRLADSGGHCGAAAVGGGCLHVGLRDGLRYWDPTVLLGHPAIVLKPESGLRT